MADRILLYISAAADLVLDREVLGRAIVEIPTSLGWRITQTPVAEERLDLEAVATADVHLLLMGADIRAPVGAEWWAARRAGRLPTLFLKQQVHHTLAGLVFIRDLERYADWRPFVDTADLRQQVLAHLTEHIVDHAAGYRISPDESARLRAWRKQQVTDKKSVDERRGGAGASSVILSTERFTPSEGQLVGQPKSEPSPRNKR